MTDELVVLPVRHHSPACASHVRARSPSATPVASCWSRGRAPSTPLIPLLATPRRSMPLAIYTWYVRAPGRATAPASGARLLPVLRLLARAAWRCATAPAARHPGALHRPRLRRAGAARRPTTARPTPGARCSTSGTSRAAARCSALAEQLGCRDHEDLWEHLFEADAACRPRAVHVARDGGVLPARPPRLHRRRARRRRHARPRGRDGLARRAALDARDAGRRAGAGRASAASTPWRCPDLLAGAAGAATAVPTTGGDSRRGADALHLRPARAAERLRRRA